MISVQVKAGKGYRVLIGAGLLKDLPAKLSEVTGSKHVMLVSDDTVWGLYGETVQAGLNEAGYRTETYVFAHGEASKNLSVYGALLEKMCDAHLTREDPVLALGGGVVGDLAGFAAATYQRGVPLVQLPTTLLAAVDSSVGGKTAVDLPNGKNQVGAFYQPALVVCDTNTFATLPETEYQNGCAEIIKYGMLSGSEELFRMLKDQPVRNRYEEIVGRCVSIKRDFVEEDEFDRGLRMLLNLGHTVGHGIEACSGFTIPHGQAVAIGMAAIARGTTRKGLFDGASAEELVNLIKAYGLPTELPFSKEEIAAKAMSDKKNTTDAMRIIIPERIGTCRIEKIVPAAFTEWF